MLSRDPRADAIASLDLATLQTFIAVMRAKSFSVVARQRNVAPSSISRTISALEETLGVRLFQRTTRRVAPTEAASLYAEHVQLALEEIGYASDEIIRRSGGLRGTLRVTTSNAFGQRCLVPLLPLFTQLHPGLKIELLLNEQRLDLVSERIDLAIRLGTLDDSGLVARKLMRTRYHVCASPSYIKRCGRPRTPQDVQAHNCLLFPLRGFGTQWLFRSKRKKLQPVPVFGNLMNGNGLVLQAAAMSGMGIALLPTWLVDEELARGKLVDLFPTFDVTGTTFDTAVWLVQPTRSRVPEKVRVLSNFLVKHLGRS